jgi:hypothetical protein
LPEIGLPAVLRHLIGRGQKALESEKDHERYAQHDGAELKQRLVSFELIEIGAEHASLQFV